MSFFTPQELLDNFVHLGLLAGIAFLLIDNAILRVQLRQTRRR